MSGRANSFGFAVSSVGLAIQAFFAALLVAQVDINWSYLVPTRLAYDGNSPVNVAGVVAYGVVAVGVLTLAFFGAHWLRSSSSRKFWFGAAIAAIASYALVSITDLSMSFFRGSNQGIFLGTLIVWVGILIGLVTIRRATSMSMIH